MSPKSYQVKSSYEKENNKEKKVSRERNIGVIDVPSESDSLDNEVSFEEALNHIGEGRNLLLSADK